MLKSEKSKLAALVKSNEVWMRESATLTQYMLTGNAEDNTVERLYSEAKRIFTEKARMEWEYRTEGIALPVDWISSLEVLVSYEA